MNCDTNKILSHQAWAYRWNEFFLKHVSPAVSKYWFVSLIHGYVGQVGKMVFLPDLMLYERLISITIIARKSTRNAGPRFFKRGITFDVLASRDVFRGMLQMKSRLNNW